MGRPKPLLPWSGSTLVQYQIRCLLDGGVNEIVVVLGHEAGAVARYVSGPTIRVVVNPNYRRGRSTSVKVGLQVMSSHAEAVLLLAVDQPSTPEIVSALITSHVKNKAQITAPNHADRGGHPLIFSAQLFDELATISEEHKGIREIFQRHRSTVNKVPIRDPMISLDLNTPEEYKKAFAWYQVPKSDQGLGLGQNRVLSI